MGVRPAKKLRQWLAANLRQAREARGWTQDRAAEAIGISVQQVRRIEAARTNTSLDLLGRIADVFRVDARTLLAPREWRRRKVGRPRSSR